MYWIVGLVGLLGLALTAASGYALVVDDHLTRFAEDTYALWATGALGLIIAAIAGIKLVLRDAAASWEYWVAGVVALAAIAMPFIFGFSNHETALWAGIVVSAAVVLVSAYEVFLAQPQRA